MAELKPFDNNVSVHQQMGDNPNTDNALSADAIKAAFDRPAEDIKAYLNDSVVPAVNANAKDIAETKIAIGTVKSTANNAASAAGAACRTADAASQTADEAASTAQAAKGVADSAAALAKEAKEDAQKALLTVTGGEFVARYGITTFAAIKNAAFSNKVCFCQGSGFIFPLVLNTTDSIVFAGVANPVDGIIMGYSVNSSNVWTTSTTVYKKTVAVDENSTNDQIPTAKAVYTAMQELESGSRGTGILKLNARQPVVLTGASEVGGKVPVARLGASVIAADAGVDKVLVGDLVLSGSLLYHIYYIDEYGNAYMDSYIELEGEDGGYYTPAVSQPDENTVRFEFTPSKEGMPTVDPVAIELPSGGNDSGQNVDLTGYATETWVQEGFQPKGDYLTDVPAGYATEEFVKNRIAEAELGGEEVDLSGYAQKSELPTKTSQLANDSGFITSAPVDSVNGKTGAVDLTASDVKARPDTWMPTAQNVGADPTGTAATAVSEHNVDTDAHGDLRLELKALSGRLTAFFDSDDTTLDELSEIVAYITNNKTLIESITTSKVGVADIVNNLTTNVANKPLSAAQGVVLKGLIDSLNTSLSGYQPKGDYALNSAIPTKVGQLANDAGYLTEHQDISGKADKFDPTVYGLPVLSLTGDISPVRVSKDNKVTIEYVYGDRSGSCTMKGQGSSSYNEAQDLGDKGKFNYTITFDTAFEAADGWGEQKKYCLKANFIDHTHARNVVSAKLWGQMVASRSGVHSTLKSCPNYGAIDGFPVVIMLNGKFHGLYTFNIPKDMWTFNMGSGTQEAVICANYDTPAVDLRVHAKVDGTDHELEEVTDEDNAGWVATSLNDLIDLCVSSYGADLDTTIAQYMDWNSAIDYLILTVLIDGRDMYKKNYILITYDGSYWIWSAYDMDSTYGLRWDAKEIYPANGGISFVKFRVNRVMELVYRFKTDLFKNRYWKLRETVLSEENLNTMFENFVHPIPSVLYNEDIRRWPSVRGSSVVTVDQILRWLRRRLPIVDKWVEELPAQETPVAPSAREGNMVPSSIDSTGAVYNGTGYKSGYTIEIEDGVESEVAADGCCITGFIPVTKDNIIKVTTDSWNISPKNSRIIFYNAEFQPMAFYTQNGFVSLFNGYTNATAINAKDKQSVTYGSDGMTTLNIAYGSACTDLAYIRIRAVGNAANLVVIREGDAPGTPEVPEEGYTNQVPLSIDMDGSVFNGVGYQDGYRLSSSGVTKAHDYSTVTGFIPAKPGDVIRIVGVEWYSNASNYMCVYDSSFTFIGYVYGEFKQTGSSMIDPANCSVLNETDALITLGTILNSEAAVNIAYIRVSSIGTQAGSGVAQKGANMIVTVNQEIT